MIYFKKNKTNFIYVHIPKCAGTSISESLINNFPGSEHLKKNKFKKICKKEISDFVYDQFFDHLPAWYIDPLLKTKVKYILVVRNPWARMFSLFQQHMLGRKKGDDKYIIDLSLDTRSQYSIYFEKKSLNEVNKIGSEKLKEVFEFWLYFIGRNKKLMPQNNSNFNILPQSWWLFNNENSILPHKIFKYENLKSFEKFLNLQFTTKMKNRFDSNKNYKFAYTKNTMEYVANLDKWVIDKFNYNF